VCILSIDLRFGTSRIPHIRYSPLLNGKIGDWGDPFRFRKLCVLISLDIPGDL